MVYYNYEYLCILDRMYGNQFRRKEYILSLQNEINELDLNNTQLCEYFSTTNQSTYMYKFRKQFYSANNYKLTELQKELVENILQTNFVQNMYATNLTLYAKKFNKAKIMKRILSNKTIGILTINNSIINNIISFY
jgi:hypothetical protein